MLLCVVYRNLLQGYLIEFHHVTLYVVDFDYTVSLGIQLHRITLYHTLDEIVVLNITTSADLRSVI